MCYDSRPVTVPFKATLCTLQFPPYGGLYDPSEFRSQTRVHVDQVSLVNALLKFTATTFTVTATLV